MPTSITPKPPLSRAYTLKASKIPNYFKVLLENPEPEVFDTAFLAKSGFRYAIDRAFIDILTGLGFLTEAGNPNRRYRDFRDRRQAATALRLGLTEAYAGLLAAMPEAAACSERQIMETVSRYFEGEINDMAACGIAATFLALTRYAAGLDNGSAIAAAAVADAPQRPAVATFAVFEPASPAPVASGPSTVAVSKPVAAPQPEPGAAPEPVAAPEPIAASEPAAAVNPAFAPVAAPEPVAPTEAASPPAAPAPAPVAPAVAEAASFFAAPLSAVAEVPAPATAMTAVPETAAPEAANDALPAADTDMADKTDGTPDIVIDTCATEALDQAQETPQRPVIYITLPASTDEAVYDAIFASLKRHMLSPSDKA